MKAYVIMKKGYEYDDNIYNELEGGTPKTIFFNLKDANEVRDKLEVEEMKIVDISYYAYDINDCVDDLEGLKLYVESMNNKYGTVSSIKWFNSEFALNKSATLEEGLEFLKMVKIRFYDIVEVGVDNRSFRDYKISEILN